MTNENKAKLVQAYRAAVAAGQDEIADLLEDVIFGEMGKEKTVAWRDAMKVAPLDNMPPTITCSGEGSIRSESRAEDAR